MGGVGVLEVFADDVGFVEGLVVVVAGGGGGGGEGGDEAARVEGKEGGGFGVGVYFDVLVGDLLFFEDEPDALDLLGGGVSCLGNGWGGWRELLGWWRRRGDTEGAEPAGVEDEWLGSLVRVDERFGETGGRGVEFFGRGHCWGLVD